MKMTCSHNKALRISAFLIATALSLGLVLFANALVGNPISRLLVSRRAKEYLSQQYAGSGYVLEKVNYSFKDNNYYVRFAVPNSEDQQFSVSFSMTGRLLYDDYDNAVANGENTARRLDIAYRNLADRVLESPIYPFTTHIAFAALRIGDRPAEYTDPSLPYLDTTQLIPDYPYNVAQLGAQYGHLTLYIYDSEVTCRRAAQILLETKALLDECSIPFYSVDFVLQPPRDEAHNSSEARIEVENFLYNSIYENGLVQRLEEANRAALISNITK